LIVWSHNNSNKEDNQMRDNLIRFKQRGFSGRKDYYNFSKRAYLRDLARIV